MGRLHMPDLFGGKDLHGLQWAGIPLTMKAQGKAVLIVARLISAAIVPTQTPDGGIAIHAPIESGDPKVIVLGRQDVQTSANLL